uniref:HTH CENPB-type domain-containing protein n=1 Tax=Oryzias latipes TaxID=8090 RepID=A0A3P9I863_ORYLA
MSAPGNEPKRQKKVLTLHEKVELLDKLKDGKSYATVGRHYGLNESTVRYIKKNEKEIRSSVASAFCGSAKMVNVVRDKTIVRMESALAFWIQDLRKKNIPLDTKMICTKARNLYAQFTTDADEFRASKGWFDHFVRRYQIRSANFHGEAASADTDAAANYPETFKQLITENGYKPEQVFNMDETALFWKKMASRTFIMKDEMKAPGFIAQKDRFTLIMCGNAAGWMMKPGLIYKSANPRALKNKNKNALPVFWMHNSKAWITKVLSSNWFYQSFIPQAREYLREKGMPFQVLLLMDNAAGHAVDLRHEGVRIEFLPPNTTSLLQPMDQGVICAFKALYMGNCLQQLVDAIDGDENFQLKVYWRNFTISSCLTVIHKALQDMKEETLNLIGGDGFDDITHEVINELVDAPSQPLTDQDLAELTQSGSENEPKEQEDPSQEDEEDEGLTLERLADLTQAAKQLQENVKSWDPYMVCVLQFSNAIDSAMSTYKTLFTSMKKQRGQLPITMFITNIKKCLTRPEKIRHRLPTPEVRRVEEWP